MLASTPEHIASSASCMENVYNVNNMTIQLEMAASRIKTKRNLQVTFMQLFFLFFFYFSLGVKKGA